MYDDGDDDGDNCDDGVGGVGGDGGDWRTFVENLMKPMKGPRVSRM